MASTSQRGRSGTGCPSSCSRHFGLAPHPPVAEHVAAGGTALVVEDEVEVVVQVNGKVRDRIEVDAGITEEDMEKAAMDSARVQEHLAGRTPRNVIIVRPKLVNLVG